LELGTVAAGIGIENSLSIHITAGIVDGMIRRTTDGGFNWNRQVHPPAMMFYDLDRNPLSTNGTLLFAGGVSLGGVGGATYSLDGETWLPVPGDHTTWSTQNVRVTDASTFYGIGTYAHSPTQYHWGVMRSNDAGRTMQYFDCNCETNARYGDFPSPTTWYITAGTWMDIPNGPALSGVHGNKFSLTPGVDIISKKDGSLDVKLNPERRLFYYEIVAKTMDGGQTFERIVENWSADCYPNYISCPSVDECWYVCDGDVLSWIKHSSDGGRSWETQYNGESHLMALHMINNLEGWAAGSDKISRIFLHTFDGGNLWVRMHESLSGFVSTLRMENKDNGYATGFGTRWGGEVWRYYDDEL